MLLCRSDCLRAICPALQTTQVCPFFLAPAGLDIKGLSNLSDLTRGQTGKLGVVGARPELAFSREGELSGSAGFTESSYMETTAVYQKVEECLC